MMRDTWLTQLLDACRRSSPPLVLPRRAKGRRVMTQQGQETWLTPLLDFWDEKVDLVEGRKRRRIDRQESRRVLMALNFFGCTS